MAKKETFKAEPLPSNRFTRDPEKRYEMAFDLIREAKEVERHKVMTEKSVMPYHCRLARKAIQLLVGPIKYDSWDGVLSEEQMAKYKELLKEARRLTRDESYVTVRICT